MRTINWLFVVSTLLFIGAIGFVIAAERRLQSAAPAAATAAPAVAPVATTLQIMEGMTMPAAAGIWDAIVTDVTADGVVEKAPQNDAEWAAVATHAAMVIESANLLMTGPRAIDQGDWMTMAKAMADQGARAMQAAAAKNKDEFLAAGDQLNVTCNNCHNRYSRG